MTTALSPNEYQVLVEQSPILIWRSGPDALCDYFNERWLAFRGRKMEEEIGNGWSEGVHPDDYMQCLQTYLENFHARTTFEMEYRVRRHDGVYRWFLDRGAPFYTGDGTFGGYVGSCVDITDRVEAQLALKDAQEREIKGLRGLLPICMHCKKIRNDDGYWTQLELYISSHSDADFTHGLCPACAKERYGFVLKGACAQKGG